ncbi:MAG: hypothetical protein GX113_10820 [Actinobacteria bacterium]|nr:hypothetical protein [Actinomycetota bacterium]
MIDGRERFNSRPGLNKEMEAPSVRRVTSNGGLPRQAVKASTVALCSSPVFTHRLPGLSGLHPPMRAIATVEDGRLVGLRGNKEYPTPNHGCSDRMPHQSRWLYSSELCWAKFTKRRMPQRRRFDEHRGSW